jgi:hypothetical protein
VRTGSHFFCGASVNDKATSNFVAAANELFETLEELPLPQMIPANLSRKTLEALAHKVFLYRAACAIRLLKVSAETHPICSGILMAFEDCIFPDDRLKAAPIIALVRDAMMQMSRLVQLIHKQTGLTPEDYTSLRVFWEEFLTPILGEPKSDDASVGERYKFGFELSTLLATDVNFIRDYLDSIIEILEEDIGLAR